MRPELVCTHKCELGEGPIWDSSNKLICWLDIVNGEIHEWSPNDKNLRTVSVGRMIGSIAITTDGNYLAALENGFSIVNRDTREIQSIIDPEKDKPKNRFNDGKCDPEGRFWAGTMSLTEESKEGSLYMLNTNGEVVKKVEDITISNGLAWSLDHKTFYFIDTPTFKVSAFDYDKVNGAISNKRTIIKISKSDGYPDGMTIDSEGMLWIAHWDGWQVTRWNPATGKKLMAFELPVSRITSCTFGGESYGDLYITSAKVGLKKEELENQPLAGSLFVIPNCGYKGLPADQFNTNIHKNLDS